MAKKRNIPQTVIQTEANSPKWWIIGGLVVVAGIGGAVWYIDRKIKQERKSRVEENALTEGSTENYAKRLALQMDKKWYMLEFPDKEEIFSVLRQIGDQKTYDQVAKDYFRLTGRTLNQDLAERLDDKEFRTPIVAPAGGLVERVYVSGAGGNQLIIRHDNGYTTGYAHLSNTLVSPGTRVRQGQTVALSGNTGRSTGPHLHFTLRYQGELIDPLKVFSYA